MHFSNHALKCCGVQKLEAIVPNIKELTIFENTTTIPKKMHDKMR